MSEPKKGDFPSPEDAAKNFQNPGQSHNSSDRQELWKKFNADKIDSDPLFKAFTNKRKFDAESPERETRLGDLLYDALTNDAVVTMADPCTSGTDDEQAMRFIVIDEANDTRAAIIASVQTGDDHHDHLHDTVMVRWFDPKRNIASIMTVGPYSFHFPSLRLNFSGTPEMMKMANTSNKSHESEHTAKEYQDFFREAPNKPIPAFKAIDDFFPTTVPQPQLSSRYLDASQLENLYTILEHGNINTQVMKTEVERLHRDHGYSAADETTDVAKKMSELLNGKLRNNQFPLSPINVGDLTNPI